MPFSSERKQDTAAFYLGVSYERYAGLTEHVYNVTANDDYYLYSLDMHYAKSHQNVYCAAGISAFKGSYQLTSFPFEEVQGQKDLWGLGMTTEGGINMRRGEFNIRPFGLKLSGTVVKGEYAEFRKVWLDTTINGVSYLNGNKNDFSLNLSFMGGITYRTGDILIGTDLLLGMSNVRAPLGIHMFISYRHLNLLMNYTYDLNFGKRSINVGLNYTFPL